MAAAGAVAPRRFEWGRVMQGPQVTWLQDGKRLHLNHGPIDLIVEAFGEADASRANPWPPLAQLHRWDAEGRAA